MFESYFNGVVTVLVLVGLFFVVKKVIDARKNKTPGSGENYRDHQPKPPTQER